MKTRTVLTGFLICLTFTLNALPRERKVRFSIGTEPHLNWIKPVDNHLEQGPVRLAISGGIRVDYHFMKPFAFSFGANWNQTGGNIIYKESTSFDLATGRNTLMPGTQVTYRLRYAEVPVDLKIVLPEIGYSTLFLESGLDPMFITGAFIDATDNNIQKAEFRQGVIPFNLAWHAGIGLDYAVGRIMSLRFELIYKNTFLDVTREYNIRKPDNVRINQVGLNVALVF